MRTLIRILFVTIALAVIYLMAIQAAFGVTRTPKRAIVLVDGSNRLELSSATDHLDILMRTYGAIPIRLSGNPEKQQDGILPATFKNLTDAIGQVDECFVYFAGSAGEGGLIMGGDVVKPQELEAMLDKGCRGRFQLIVSGSFSGLYLDQMSHKLGHIIMTSSNSPAREPSRTGYAQLRMFDACLINGVQLAENNTWGSLYMNVFKCVDAEEKRMKTSPFFKTMPTIRFNRIDSQSLLPWRK